MTDFDELLGWYLGHLGGHGWVTCVAGHCVRIILPMPGEYRCKAGIRHHPGCPRTLWWSGWKCMHGHCDRRARDVHPLPLLVQQAFQTLDLLGGTLPLTAEDAARAWSRKGVTTWCAALALSAIKRNQGCVRVDGDLLVPLRGRHA